MTQPLTQFRRSSRVALEEREREKGSSQCVRARRLTEQRPTREDADREHAETRRCTIRDDVAVIRLAIGGGRGASGTRVEDVVRHLEGGKRSRPDDLAHRLGLASSRESEMLDQPLFLESAKRPCNRSEYIGRRDRARLFPTLNCNPIVKLKERHAIAAKPFKTRSNRTADKVFDI